MAVNPALFRWARERAGLAQEDLSRKFKKLGEWEAGKVHPTLKQVEMFARAVHVPAGYMFLSKPPQEQLPIPDFRTVAGETPVRPSPNLIDTIYACQERQNWYREFARVSQQSELGFVGSATLRTRPDTVASRMRKTLDFDVNAQKECATWTDALRHFTKRADKAGMLVMVSGVAMGNNRHHLDVSEFRGFALADPFAPLVFVNGADAKAAQMFTLAHELAHIWLGVSALSNMETEVGHIGRREEIWCNKVAAEFLVPSNSLDAELMRDESLPDKIPRLARTFKVSTLVVLRRLLDAEYIDYSVFKKHWDEELERFQASKRDSSKEWDFYKTAISRVGARFVRALVVNTLEGKTLYRDAFRMLGISNVEKFKKLGREAGMVL